ncbi:alpha/beta fold hydrolase [Chromobacterium phragmitis]|uniref:Alpha/beta fold hydrolase n=2 Tax=Chromobacterium phragmitis TaxID=2202141 RepID=A0A344ULN9_9NEIS|nr:esterase [Chromobacterium phragmitis]
MEKLQQDLYVPVGGGERLFLKRIGRPGGEPVLMAHGVMANGRIFYTDTGKGLAHFLADAGYDVYVADLRGRGRSTPKIGPHSRHGQTETICEDLPALHEFVRRKSGGQRAHWIAHSWGGVHMTSCLVRYPEIAAQVGSAVYFGAKRSVRVRNLNKLIEVDFMWNTASRWLIRAFGYLPARRIRLGADDESDKSHLQSKLWAQPKPWVDSDDGFDYAAAAEAGHLPPILYFAAANDPCRGHPEDVRRFRDESGPHLSRLHLLGRRAGHLHDYNHVSLLTHPDAPRDHFPLALDWLAGRCDAVAENY